MQTTPTIAIFRAPHFDTEEVLRGGSPCDGLLKVDSRLSDILAVQFKDRAFEVGPPRKVFKPIGVARTLEVAGRRFAMYVGYDKEAGEWAVSVVPIVSLMARLFGNADAAGLEEICEAIDLALRSGAGVSEVRWLTVNEFEHYCLREQRDE